MHVKRLGSMLGDKLATVVAHFSVGVTVWAVLALVGVWQIVPLATVPGLLAVITIVAVAWRWWVGRAILLVVMIAAGLVIVTVTETTVTYQLAASLIRRDSLPAATPLTEAHPVADAVVVLSAGVNGMGMLSPEAIDRMLAGERLIRDGRAPVLVLSRPAHALRVGTRPDQDWQRLLALLPAVPPLEFLDSVETTHDEALQLAQRARTLGWHRVIVVTSPMHTRRACGTFERAGVSVLCVPSESRDFALPEPAWVADRLAVFAMWLHEAVGWEVYRWRGWV